MALSTAEIESLRYHLGYGNVGIEALPYTDDGWWSIFDSVVSPYLGTGTETSSTTAITAGGTVEVTPAAMAGITAYAKLVVDVAEQAEVVTVKAVTASTFTAYFSKAHTAGGYPIATMSGIARLRMLLHDADIALAGITDISVAATAGLKSVDKEDVVWFEGRRVLGERVSHYRSIVATISSLVRVPSRQCSGKGRSVAIEAY